MKYYTPIALMLLASMCGKAQTPLDPTSDKILYEVATAHLDTQWNWTIQDTINSYIPNTLHQNFALFTNYPHYTFSFEGAFRYQLAKEYYPDDYLTLSNYVAQGRWHVAGSVVDAGDVNVPSPESLMRNILYANHYWKQEFGKTSTDIFLPDCFGFGYALPSVAAHCGLKGFSSQKLSWGSSIPIPFNIGRWVGPDGNSVVAALDPGAYVSTLNKNLANDSGALSRINDMGAATGLYIDYRYVGTGDVGGAPTEASVDWLEQSVTTTNGLLNVLNVASDQLFRDLTPTQVGMLSSYQGELLMKTHGTGCYTSHPENKRYNRQNEQRADAAERAAVVADWLQGGGTYPQEKLNKAWERFLWHQFHDDLTGTSIPQAYPFSWNDYLLSLNEFASVEKHSVGVIAKALDTRVQGVPLVVYNPLAQAREDVVDARVTFTNGIPAAVRVYDANGNEVPSQMSLVGSNGVAVTFLANVPSGGSAVYDVRPAASPSALSTGLSVSASQLENGRYVVQLDGNGNVSSIFDKVSNRELLNAPIRWDFFSDRSIDWPAWEVMFSDLTAAPLSYLSGPAVVNVVENGPARVSLSVTRANAGSIFTEQISLAAGSAGNSVNWDVSANWASPKTLLKVEFPLTATNANATYDLGLGTIQRPNNTANLYEVPAQQWVDLTGSNAAYGVTIMNDCRYGWDKPNNHTLRMTVFHSPDVGGNYVYQATNGFGTHRFGFAVMGHTNDWRSGGSPQTAARFNQPLQAFQTTMHNGALGKSFAFLSCNNSNVMVKAVKRAEDSNEIIVRLQELTGTPQTAQLSCLASITAAREVNGAEEAITSLSPSSGNLTVSLGGYSPKTLALTLAPTASSLPAIVSDAVTLPYNLDAVSTDGNRTDGDFESGLTYPAELLPSTVVRDGVTFHLGSTSNGAFNAVSCQGQTIPLSGSGHDQLYLLAASSSNAITAPFTVDGQATNLTVQYFTGFFGQWGKTQAKPDEVGWVCTHRHTAAGANEAYRFCYLYKYRLALPPNATSLVLPNAPNIRIFAMTLTTNTPTETVPAGGPLQENLLPWADAGPDRRANAALSNNLATVTLDASKSVDPDGSIVAYQWFLNGTEIATGMTTQVNLTVGTNRIWLSATDNNGGSSMDDVTIVVRPALAVTIAATQPSATNAPATVTFTGQASGGAGTLYDSTDDHLGTVTAQGENLPNEAAVKLFDNDTATKWLDFANGHASSRSSWIQYQYPSGLQCIVTNYTLTSANDAPERDPSAWALLGSNNGGSTWDTLDVRTNQSFSSRFQTRTFSNTNTTAYNVYRLRIDRVANPSSANSVQLAELELLSAPLYIMNWSFGDGSTAATISEDGTSSVPHTYTNNGAFTAVLEATFGDYSGSAATNVIIGAPLAATLTPTPGIGAAPLAVQFTSLASGGSGGRGPYDSTDDNLGTITAQSENSPNEPAANAFDNLAGTKWLDFANANPNTRSSWIQYQYPGGAKYSLIRYTLTSANDATAYSERNPRDWRLLGSTNNGISWVTLDTQTNQTFTANYQKVAYNLTNSTAFNLYRLQIDSVETPLNANSVQLAEIEFITQPTPYGYSWFFGDGTTSTEQNPQHTYANIGTYNVSLVVQDGLSTITNTTQISVMPPPTLGLAPAAGGMITLSWPAWASDYHLYSTTNLVPPVVWSLTPQGVTNQNGILQVIVPVNSHNRFFQLRKP